MSPSASFSVPGDSETETSSTVADVSAENDDAFRWHVRPSDKDPGKRWGVLAVAALAFVLGLWLLHHPLYGLLGFAIILASTAEYWLGVSYKLDSRGASARCGLSLTALDWGDVKRAMLSEEGVKLSPLESAGRMDAFRGVFLRFGSEKDRVIETVRRLLPNHVRLLEG